MQVHACQLVSLALKLMQILLSEYLRLVCWCMHNIINFEDTTYSFDDSHNVMSNAYHNYIINVHVHNYDTQFLISLSVMRNGLYPSAV